MLLVYVNKKKNKTSKIFINKYNILKYKIILKK